MTLRDELFLQLRPSFLAQTKRQNSKNFVMTTRSAAVKRLMKELSELEGNPSPEFTARPLEDDLFEWHFTLRGPAEGML